MTLNDSRQRFLQRIIYILGNTLWRQSERIYESIEKKNGLRKKKQEKKKLMDIEKKSNEEAEKGQEERDKSQRGEREGIDRHTDRWTDGRTN